MKSPPKSYSERDAKVFANWDTYALKPEVTGLQSPKPAVGLYLQAADAATDISEESIPALQMFAKARMCFIPYCVSGPQLDSKVRTCTLQSTC